MRIRFPSHDGRPLAGGEAGTIIYVFTGGAVTICPDLVFATQMPGDQNYPSA